MVNSIIDQLKRDEGFRENVYIDTAGKSTIGYGHNLDANPLPYVSVSEPLAESILDNDVHGIINALTAALPWHDSLNDARFGVLINMGFNMGLHGLIGFHHMLTFAQNGDYSHAALAMTQSAWYTEVGDRAKRLVQQMQTGLWV